MSEFFKALEQAERDRARQEQADAASAPAEKPKARENGIPAPEPVVAAAVVPDTPAAMPQSAAPPAAVPREPAVTRRPAVTTRPTTPPAVTTKPTAPTPVATKPAAPPPVTEPTPPPVMAIPTAAPSSTFRPSLRTTQRSGVLRRFGRRIPVLVAQTHPASIEAEAYRTVRANLELMSANGSARHIVVTSATGGDGKSTTAANLAIVVAQGGRRVCLVDADFRRPTLHDMFGLPNVDGLAAALEYAKPLPSVARSADIENLSVVVAGRGSSETFHDILTPQRLSRILEDSEADFDVVIFDCPPVISSDALSVAAVCGGVLLVVRAGRISFGTLRRAIGQITQVKAKVLGVLLNQFDPRAADAGAHHYYHAYHTPRSKG
jgi:capsular exopolysaccharide synthesis family protein